MQGATRLLLGDLIPDQLPQGPGPGSCCEYPGTVGLKSPVAKGRSLKNHPATCKQDPEELFPSFLASTARSSQPGWS